MASKKIPSKKSNPRQFSSVVVDGVERAPSRSMLRAVGFKEEEVINYVRKIRQDVVFVRNPNYSTTTNSYSLYLGTYDLREPYLTIDGDMIVDAGPTGIEPTSVLDLHRGTVEVLRAGRGDVSAFS